ncbi:MAG: hypothetical protein EP319_00370 [Deltaproteobacteria bacterium]|nr:MAG: hypothetical protein EP319_00370 [Deltaproteobacteria bacterium]
MRICFYSTDPEVAEIGSLLEGIEVTMASSLDEVQDCVNSSDEKILLFIDLDGNKSEAEFVNSTLYEDTSVIRIIITAKASVKELKKHQLSEVSAYGYIKKPLTGKLVASLVNNFEIADYVEENNLLNEGDKAVEEAELTFVGVRSDLSGASDSDFEEDDDEVFEAAPMQMPKPGDSGDSDDDEDMDNILQFGSGDDEEVDGDQKTATDIQDAPDEPVKLSHEETKVLEKHGVLNENWKVTYESELNEKIQAKFDRVFSEGAGGLPDFEISEPTPERDDDDDFEESTNEADVAAISLDFGGDDEEPSVEEISSPEMDLSDDEYLEESTKQDIVAPEPMVTDEATGEFEVAEMLADDDSSAEEINIQEPEQDSPQNSEVNMTDRDDEDDILDFNIPSDDDADEAEESSGGMQFDTLEEQDDSEDDSDELGFSIDGSDDEEGESDSEAVAELEFGEEDDDEELSAAPSPSEDLDFGDDDDELDLSGGDDEMSADSTIDDELDLGDDMDLDLSDAEVQAANAAVDDGDDFDLDAMELDDDVDVSDVDDDLMGDMDLDAMDEEETAEVASLESAEETDEVLDFGAGADDDEGIDDEATVATMLFSNDGATKEALDAARVPEDLSADESEDVDLASLIEEDDEDEELGFSLGEEEEDGMTETLLGASEEDDDHTGDATETLVSSGVDEDATQPTMVAHIPQRAEVATFTPASSDETIEITPPERRVASAYNEDELMRLQATIRQLREERDGLLKDINDLKTEKKLVDQENLGLKAELDEVKIELTIVKKRHQDEIEEMQYRIRLADEKKAISEEKSRQMQKEFDRLSQKVRIDFNQVKQREKELESQLELVTMDSESQVRSRDMKILELKRKIDQLEFNMENSAIKETKAREDKVKVEEKLAKIMKTLRGSIQVLEDDLELDEELIEKIKKV